MSGYPDLGQPVSTNDETSSADSSDEGDMYEEMLGSYYDEYGQLITPGAQSNNHIQPSGASSPTAVSQQPGLSTPLVKEVPSSEISAPSTPAQLPAVPPTGASAAAVKNQLQVTLTRGANGKLGIQLRRMGNSIFFAFVEQGSSAAKQGIGFGDQLVGMRGIHLPGMTGSSLMRLIAQNSGPFCMTITRRPYDFNLVGYVGSAGELTFTTPLGKILGRVKLEKVARKGHLNHLQILEVNNNRVLGKRSREIANIFNSPASTLSLRVMPRMLVNHLLRGQDRRKASENLQFSPIVE